MIGLTKTATTQQTESNRKIRSIMPGNSSIGFFVMAETHNAHSEHKCQMIISNVPLHRHIRVFHRLSSHRLFFFISFSAVFVSSFCSTSTTYHFTNMAISPRRIYIYIYAHMPPFNVDGRRHITLVLISVCRSFYVFFFLFHFCLQFSMLVVVAPYISIGWHRSNK